MFVLRKTQFVSRCIFSTVRRTHIDAPAMASSLILTSAIKTDRFKCVHLNVSALKSMEAFTVETFDGSLRDSIAEWTTTGYRAIWCRVALEDSDVIPALVKNNFVYHHAKPNFVVMNRWISTQTNNIPPYPYTNIGVGAIVVDSDDRVLVVKEKYNFPNVPRLWKFPGGYSSQGEEFWLTAEREVLEETGVKASFKSMVALRHLHKFQFDCSDVYIVCHLEPSSSELIRCQQEIADVSWISITELRDQLSEFNRYVLDKYIDSRRNHASIGLDKIQHIVTKEDSSVYALKPEEN